MDDDILSPFFPPLLSHLLEQSLTWNSINQHLGMAGGNGNDILDGGNGADTLYGEQGKRERERVLRNIHVLKLAMMNKTSP